MKVRTGIPECTGRFGYDVEQKGKDVAREMFEVIEG